MKTYCLLLLGIGCPIFCAKAQFTTIEPDNYTNGTVLNTIVPGVSLVTAASDNLPIPFNVTANTSVGFAPTGDKVFGHANVAFMNSDRRLRMDFTSPVGFLSIAFGSGSSINAERGQVDVYDSGNHLLASYLSQPRLKGQFETLSISRPTADIAWGVAYVPPTFGSFGQFDHLVFSPVPEPSTILLSALGAVAIFGVRTAGKRGERSTRRRLKDTCE
jgi:hypothetical protein